jgi:hypothetical protein
MCAETAWRRCHRRLIAELLTAQGHDVVHLIGPGRREPHRLYDESEIREGGLYLCGSRVGSYSRADSLNTEKGETFGGAWLRTTSET